MRLSERYLSIALRRSALINLKRFGLLFVQGKLQNVGLGRQSEAVNSPAAKSFAFRHCCLPRSGFNAVCVAHCVAVHVNVPCVVTCDAGSADVQRRNHASRVSKR